MGSENLVWSCLLAFVVGAVYDALNVGFIASSEGKKPVAAGVFSVLVGGAGLTGFWEAIHNAWAVPFLLLGYFVGTYAAVGWKARRANNRFPHRCSCGDDLYEGDTPCP